MTAHCRQAGRQAGVIVLTSFLPLLASAYVGLAPPDKIPPAWEWSGGAGGPVQCCTSPRLQYFVMFFFASCEAYFGSRLLQYWPTSWGNFPKHIQQNIVNKAMRNVVVQRPRFRT